MNKVILIGRISNDLELKYTPNNVAYMKVVLAIDKMVGDQKKTNFIQCVCWRGDAEFLSKYCKKGRMIYLEGEIDVSNYTNSKGEKVYVTQVVANQVRGL